MCVPVRVWVMSRDSLFATAEVQSYLEKVQGDLRAVQVEEVKGSVKAMRKWTEDAMKANKLNNVRDYAKKLHEGVEKGKGKELDHIWSQSLPLPLSLSLSLLLCYNVILTVVATIPLIFFLFKSTTSSTPQRSAVLTRTH